MSEHKAAVFCRIGADNEQVMLLFAKDVEGAKPAHISQWRLDPAECLKITEAMAAAAFEADSGLKPVGDALKASLIEGHRDKLVPRITLMLASMKDDGKTDGYKALQIVDAIFSEIFS